MMLYRNNLKNREFDKEALQNAPMEQVIIAGKQGASEQLNFGGKPTTTKTDFSGCFGIKYPVADLHCDLLLYLSENKERSYLSSEVRCSFPQLEAGNVKFQTLAIFTETTKGSTLQGKKQIEAFKSLPTHHFLPISSKPTSQIGTVLAIENASGLLEEEEPLEQVFKRGDHYLKEVGPFLYLSMTWNTENRFGGGNLTEVGLKKDGVSLLEYLDGKKIAIDLSHTCDRLAYDILNTIDKKGLKITPIASHSNFRKVKECPRNLPDELAKEIIRRKGVIGLNLIRGFIGEPFLEQYLKMFEHAASLNGLDSLCFGADFFYEEDVASSLQSLLPFFDEEYGSAACYPKILSCLKTRFSHPQLEAISHLNFCNFLKRQQLVC